MTSVSINPTHQHGDGTDGLEDQEANAHGDELGVTDLDRLLAEIADEVGPVPPELAAKADAAWRAS